MFGEVEARSTTRQRATTQSLICNVMMIVVARSLVDYGFQLGNEGRKKNFYYQIYKAKALMPCRREMEGIQVELERLKNFLAKEFEIKDLGTSRCFLKIEFVKSKEGQPKRHLLTTGWSVFVSAKRLVAGDSVLFIWNEKNQLLLGIRRATRPQTVMPSSVLSSDSMHIGLLAAAAHAAATNSCFTIFYNPRASPSEFVIPLSKYVKAVFHTRVSVGMRFRMLFETEESSVRETQKPAATEHGYLTWEFKNSMVMLGWVMYSDLGNVSQLFELQFELKEKKQGDSTMTDYYNTLIGLWQESDLFDDNTRACPDCSVRYTKKLEKERLFAFLHGLNKDLDEVRGRILGTKPLPGIQDAFAEVRREESRNVQIMESSGQILVSSVRLLTCMKGDGMIVYGVIIVSDITIVEKIVGNYMGNQQIGNQESKAQFQQHNTQPNPTPSSSIAQKDLYLGRTIGSAKEHDGLYYLEDHKQVVNKQAQALNKASGSSGSTCCHSNSTAKRLNRKQIPNLKESQGGKESQVSRAINKKICCNNKMTWTWTCQLQSGKWKAAIMEEMQVLKKNDTWDIVELPKGKYLVDCKWVFTIKYKSDGNINRYKAQLVAKAANLDRPLHHMDVKNAFLNGELDEENIEIPKDYTWKSDILGKNEKRGVEAYTDVDWVGSIDDRKSTTEYCTFVWGNLVTWRSKKQNVVARSSTETEYRALAGATSAISIAYILVHHDHTKHEEVDKHFIKAKIENGVICMTYVLTTQQIGDILTKGLSRHIFEDLANKLGMIDIYSPT
ncbi:Auxin response factor 12 [Vitis vinifera]|uniref:Auxin response factor 12 n=1 Tax=Vitis vinifera TaxID=29760 RepID=A0A438BWE3_VITVI|nr:Auxin response factor 12 [Vitis vinifera]